MTGSSPTMEYDPFSPAFQADPFPVTGGCATRRRCIYSEKWNWWALSRFDDVRAAALDPDTFLSTRASTSTTRAKDQSAARLPARHRQPPPRPDPPDRAAALPAARDRRARGRRPRPRAQAGRRLARPRHRRPGPGAGLADAERRCSSTCSACPRRAPTGRALERWVHELKDRKPDDARLTPVARAATAGIQSYFVDLLNERRRDPRADLVTHLVTRRDRRRAVRGRAHRPPPRSWA